jgi:hypothetical protein
VGDDDMTRENRDHPWWVDPASMLGAASIRALGNTWRVEWIGSVAAVEERIARGEPHIFAFWHARMLPLTFTHRGRGAAVLVSRSRDGELIARTIERLGFVTARGSSTRGGREGALEMLEWAGNGRILHGITPDGPRGPAERMKPGLVWLASRTGRPVVPVATAASRGWKLNSWDGFRIPGPFARVIMGYGEPLSVPSDLDERAAEVWRDRLERALNEITRAVARRAGEAA